MRNVDIAFIICKFEKPDTGKFKRSCDDFSPRKVYEKREFSWESALF